MSDIPTIREELDRKTVEAMNALVLGYDQGRYTAEQVSLGYDVIFQTVSGLVSEDVIRIYTDSASSLPPPALKINRYFVHENGELTIKLAWTTGDSFFVVIRIQFGEVIEGRHVEYGSAQRTKKALDEFCETLSRKGWSEI